MSIMRRRSRPLLTLFGLSLLTIILLVLPLLVPGNLVTTDQRGDATIYFAADRGTVFAPGACVTVRWRVEGIQEVRLNGVPTVGEGTSEVCLDGRIQPRLDVTFRDGTVQDYRLAVTFLVQQPGIWLLTFALLVLLVAFLFVAVSPAMETRAGHGIGMLIRFLSAGLLTVALIALAVELALRFYFGAFGSQIDRIAYVYTREQINQLDPYVLPLPGVDYGLSAAHPDHNRLGFRGAEIELPKPAGVYRIVAIGGSTTYGTSVKKDETYPYYLQQILREIYGRPNVEVVNAGVLGYTTYQNVASLAFRVVELEPDLVITYDNGNDVLTREVNPDCYRGLNPARGIDPRLRVARNTVNQPLPWSTLYRFIAFNIGAEPNPAGLNSIFTNIDVGCGDSRTYSKAEMVKANPPLYFERNLVSMIGLARIHNFAIAFATWAYHESAPEAEEYWRQAVAEQNEILRQVAARYDVPLLDYAPAAPQDAAYWADYIHMSAAGSRDQAAFFARELNASGLLD